MSRFGNIEFEEKKPRPPSESGGIPERGADFFYQEAETAYLAGDFELALRNYSRTLEHDNAFFEGWFGQVTMLIELGEYEEALMWADKALEMFPQQPALLAAKAVASVRRGVLDKALPLSDEAITKKGLSPYVWISRAEILLARRSLAAEHCLANAINAAGNKVALARLESGRVLLRYKRLVPALQHLLRAAGDLPKSALAWYELGRCQAALNLPDAVVSLTQCVTLRPGWKEAGTALKKFQSRGLVARVAGPIRKLFGG